MVSCLVWQANPGRGQPSPEEQLDTSIFEAPLQFQKGRLVVDRKNAVFKPSSRFQALLAKRVSAGGVTKELCEAVDRQFRRMPKAYYLTLALDQRKLDEEGMLKNPHIDRLRSYNGPASGFPATNFQRVFSSEVLPSLARMNQRSAVRELVEPEEDRAIEIATDPLVFRVRDPVDSFAPPHFAITVHTKRPVIDPAGVVELLAPLRGLPADPARIRARLDEFYASRGLSPHVQVDVDSVPRTITIDEDRVAKLLLPRELDGTQAETAFRIVYNTTPHRVYSAFRSRGPALLDAPLAADAIKREIVLTDLVAAAEGADGAATFEEPHVHRQRLQQQQALLARIGFQANLVESARGAGFVDISIAGSVRREGAAGAETPESAVRASARPGASLDRAPEAPDPLRRDGPPAPPAPSRDRRRFLGGGVEYKPGQGVRLFGTGHATRLFGPDRFTAEAGGHGSGFGKGSYVRDYVWFNRLPWRLGLEAAGGTEFQNKRILAGDLTNERRTGAMVRAELEPFRDRNGHKLAIAVEGRRQSVRLSSDNAGEQAANLTVLDLGLIHEWCRWTAKYPGKLRLEPMLRFGLGLSGSERSFQRLRFDAAWHQLLPADLEADLRLHGGAASGSTPVFELPSFGGEEIVRGFRADDALGRRLWALQSELWVPFPRLGDPASKTSAFLRRNVWLAPFYDFGGLHRPLLSASGFRQGLGAGVRLSVQGALLALDWAYGRGRGASGDGRGRLYFTVRLP